MRLLAPLTLCLALALGPAAKAGADDNVTVFAAASLTEALEVIGINYQEITAITVRLSFAASSTLARQIEAGAPADVVALASSDWADYLEQRALILPETRISPIGNGLVLIVPADSAATFPGPLTAAGLHAALGPAGRMAIGDPAHVPAGAYARQALETLGLWSTLAPRLAYADNVRAALALVSHGGAPLGIVYATDARAAPGVRIVATLPNTAHAPITYAFAAVTDGNHAKALDFLAFLSGPEALAIFARHGFTDNLTAR